MSAAVNAFLDIVRKSHATQQIISDVLKRGTPAMLVCSSCGSVKEHRALRMDGTCYTVCRYCHAMTTTNER